MNTRPRAKIVAFEFAGLALIGLGIVGLIRGGGGAVTPDAMSGWPGGTVDLSAVTEGIAAD